PAESVPGEPCHVQQLSILVRGAVLRRKPEHRHRAVDVAGDDKSVRSTVETDAGRLRADRHMLNDRAVSIEHGQTLDRKPVIEKDVLAGGIEIYAIHVGELVFRLADDRRGTN